MIVQYNNKVYRIDSPILDRLSYVYANSIAFDESFGVASKEVEVDLSFLPQSEVKAAVDYLSHPSMAGYANLNDEIIEFLGINEPTRDIILYDDFMKMKDNHRVVWDITPDIYEVCLNLVQYAVSFGYDSIICGNNLLETHLHPLLVGSNISLTRIGNKPLNVFYDSFESFREFSDTSQSDYYLIGGDRYINAELKRGDHNIVELNDVVRYGTSERGKFERITNNISTINTLKMNPLVDIQFVGVLKGLSVSLNSVYKGGILYMDSNEYAMLSIAHLTRRKRPDRRVTFIKSSKVPMQYISFGDILNDNIVLGANETHHGRLYILIYNENALRDGKLTDDAPITIYSHNLSSVCLSEYYRTNPLTVYTTDY